jgi:hypothetical protein
MRGKILLSIAALAISALALAGCNGGGGGAAPAANTVSMGVIAAPGTVAVNGVFYNVSSAGITIDGRPGKASDLQVGMVVSVRGIFDNRTSHAIRRTATSVAYDSDIQGPVDCISILNNSLTIMGQQVVVSTTPPHQTIFANFSSTRIIFANVSTVAKLSAHLSPQYAQPQSAQNPQPTLYNVVKVSGFSYIVDPTYSNNGIHGFQATRIELVSQGVDLSTAILLGIRGTIDSLDPIGMAFTIGNLSIDYSGLNPVYVPLHFTSGQFVSLKEFSSNFTPGNAPSMSLVTPGSLVVLNQGVLAQDGDHVSVQGIVSGFSGTTFTVSGTTVNAATISLTGVANAVMVEVEGTMKSGVLNATSLTLL